MEDEGANSNSMLAITRALGSALSLKTNLSLLPRLLDELTPAAMGRVYQEARDDVNNLHPWYCDGEEKWLVRRSWETTDVFAGRVAEAKRDGERVAKEKRDSRPTADDWLAPILWSTGWRAHLQMLLETETAARDLDGARDLYHDLLLLVWLEPQDSSLTRPRRHFPMDRCVGVLAMLRTFGYTAEVPAPEGWRDVWCRGAVRDDASSNYGTRHRGVVGHKDDLLARHVQEYGLVFADERARLVETAARVALVHANRDEKRLVKEWNPGKGVIRTPKRKREFLAAIEAAEAKRVEVFRELMARFGC